MKTFKAKGMSPKAGNRSPGSPDKNSNLEEEDEVSTPKSGHMQSFDIPDLSEPKTIDKIEEIRKKEEKEVKRQQDFKKKIQEDKKKGKKSTAFESLGQYQQRILPTPENEEKSVSPSLRIQPPTHLSDHPEPPFDPHSNPESQPQSPTRQTIEISANSRLSKNPPLDPLRTDRGHRNFSLPESGDDSYSKDDHEILKKSNLEVREIGEYGLPEIDGVEEHKNFHTNPPSRVESPSSAAPTMRQNYLDTYREQRTVVGTRGARTAKNNIQVKGKASIKNLIRVAATRK